MEILPISHEHKKINWEGTTLKSSKTEDLGLTYHDLGTTLLLCSLLKTELKLRYTPEQELWGTRHLPHSQVCTSDPAVPLVSDAGRIAPNVCWRKPENDEINQHRITCERVHTRLCKESVNKWLLNTTSVRKTAPCTRDFDSPLISLGKGRFWNCLQS